MLQRLWKARLDAGLAQVQVVERVGVGQTFVSKVELGERRIDPVELARFVQRDRLVLRLTVVMTYAR